MSSRLREIDCTLSCVEFFLVLLLCFKNILKNIEIEKKLDGKNIFLTNQAEEMPNNSLFLIKLFILKVDHFFMIYFYILLLLFFNYFKLLLFLSQEIFMFTFKFI